MQRTYRRFGWPAAASAVLLAAGALAGTSGVIADAAPPTPQAVHVHLAYACRFPSGPQHVKVTVAGTFPTAVTAGKPIRPHGLRTTVVLPRAAVAGLARLGAATAATGRDVLSVTVTGSGNLVSARWPGQTPKPARLPAFGGLSLAAPATVSPITVSTPAKVTFIASGIALTLIPRKASGVPATPSAVRVACTPSPGQDATLATVRVTSTSPSPSASPTPSKRTPSQTVPESHKPPKGCGAIHVKAPQIACAYLPGYANVKKLNGAALLEPAKPAKPGLTSIAENYRKPKHIKNGLIEFNIARLYYKGREELPPVRTTFLGFGFMPITATLKVKELKPILITIKFKGIHPPKTEAKTLVSFQLSDAFVNGVPWKNLGSHCRTSRPVRLDLIGHYPALTIGGTLGGMVKIPPFTGCGVGENLDPLFTASISGPRNFDLMTQGPLCLFKPFFPKTCPPPVPKPRR